MADASPALNYVKQTVEAGGQTLVTVPAARSFLWRSIVRSDGKPVALNACMTPAGEIVDAFAPVWGGDMGMMPGRGFAQIFVRNTDEYFPVTFELITSPEYISTSKVSGSVQIVNGQLPDSTIERALVVQGDEFNQQGIPFANSLQGSYGTEAFLTESAWAYYGLPPPNYDYAKGLASVVPEDGGYVYLRGDGWDDDYPVFLTSRYFKVTWSGSTGTGVRLFPPEGKRIYIQSWTSVAHSALIVMSAVGDILSQIQWNTLRGLDVPLVVDGSRGEYLVIKRLNSSSSYGNYIQLRLYFPDGNGATEEDRS